MRFTIANEEDRENVITYIKNLNHNKKFVGEIKLFRTNRSIKQNSLYWLWLTAIQDQTGNQKEDLHDYFSSKYLRKNTTVVLGNAWSSTKSTKDLDTVEFNEYLDKIYAEVTMSAYAELYYPTDAHWDNFYTYYSEKL